MVKFRNIHITYMWSNKHEIPTITKGMKLALNETSLSFLPQGVPEILPSKLEISMKLQ
jgi:hypothetical protein